MFFPMVVASCTDSIVALGRIGQFLASEELDEPYTVEPENKLAIDAEGDFTWETAHKPPPEALPDFTKAQSGHRAPASPKDKKDKKEKGQGKGEKGGRRGWFGRKGKDEPVLPTDGSKVDEKDKKDKETEEKPFELKDLSFKVPRGSFAVVLGPIGSGKVGLVSGVGRAVLVTLSTLSQSSLVQALVGEMRRTRGHVSGAVTISLRHSDALLARRSCRRQLPMCRRMPGS